MDATNRLDPASKNLNLQVGNIPSNSQSYFVDTSLLEEVRVYDSFVPAEYGRFTGGVVDARLRRYSGENHLSLDYRWNTSKMTQQKVAEGEEASWAQASLATRRNGKSASTRRGGSGFQRKSGAVLAVSRRQSDITRWNMGVDGRASRCPARTTIATKSTISWASSACAPARGPRPTWCSNTATARKHWSATSSAKPAGTTTMRRAASASTSTTSSRAGAIRCRPAGTARSATAYRSATSWSLSSPGLPQYTAGGFGKEQKQQDSWTSKAASTWIRCAPAQSRTSLRRPGMAAGAGRVRTLPAIAFLPSRLRQQGRLPTSAGSATCPAPWT